MQKYAVNKFYVPEYCVEEIERHVGEISERSGLSIESVYLLLGVLLASVRVVPAERILKKIKEAEDVMGKLTRMMCLLLRWLCRFLMTEYGLWTSIFLSKKE